MKVLSRNVYCHICAGGAIYFYLLVNVLAWDNFPIHLGVVASFLVSCLVLSDVSYTHDWWFLHGRDVPLFIYGMNAETLMLLIFFSIFS